MGKSYCPGWSQTVAEGNFCAKTPAYLCGNQPVSQVLAISAPRPSERPKLGHDLREIHTNTTRDHELKDTATHIASNGVSAMAISGL